MQKSGVPIAERPNLLLKGSGRVNRFLGSEEESDRRSSEELEASEKAAGAVNTRFDIATRSGIGLARVSILLILQVP